ncbi:MAG TPA: hypothetical protein VK826_14870, partial [Bacteroidia bacterium]|nr:hypothetical protein [Bacteroidia bacterium]
MDKFPVPNTGSLSTFGTLSKKITPAMSTEEKKNTTRRTPQHAQVSQQLYEIGKLPPQAVELEEAVLGALMLEKDA